MNDFNVEFDETIVVPSGEHNAIETISVNGVRQPINNENVDITVPTKVSELQNDSGFVTTDKIPSAPIQSISVNGENVAPDELGNVNIEIEIPEIELPENLATTNYVDDKIGDISEILASVNADLSAI